MTGRTAIRAAYLAAAAFIVAAPLVPQLLGYQTPALRSWRMFSGVGLGMLRGEFIVITGDAEARESPLQFFGLERYPVGEFYRFDRLVLRHGDLERIAAARCAELPPGARLSYVGEVGILEGWTTLEIADLCEGAE